MFRLNWCNQGSLPLNKASFLTSGYRRFIFFLVWCFRCFPQGFGNQSMTIRLIWRPFLQRALKKTFQLSRLEIFPP